MNIWPKVWSTLTLSNINREAIEANSCLDHASTHHKYNARYGKDAHHTHPKILLSRSLHPCCKKTSNLLHKLPITQIATICIPWTIEYLSPCELHNWLSIRRDIKIVPVVLVIICLQLGTFKLCLTLLAPMCTHSFPLHTFISILRGKLPKFLTCQNPAPE